MKRNILNLARCSATPLDPSRVKRKKMENLVFTFLTVAAAFVFSGELIGVSDSAPKVSPFTEVRFEQQQVVVTYEGQDYQWLELDGIKAETIVAAAQRRFRIRWQKRVSEDLVDMLWGMDHQPGGTVSLLLRDFETNEQRFIEQAPMTTRNRFSVKRNRRG